MSLGIIPKQCPVCNSGNTVTGTVEGVEPVSIYQYCRECKADWQSIFDKNARLVGRNAINPNTENPPERMPFRQVILLLSRDEDEWDPTNWIEILFYVDGTVNVETFIDDAEEIEGLDVALSAVRTSIMELAVMEQETFQPISPLATVMTRTVNSVLDEHGWRDEE